MNSADRLALVCPRHTSSEGYGVCVWVGEAAFLFVTDGGGTHSLAPDATSVTHEKISKKKRLDILKLTLLN
jgi:hypothetical protein